mgnify:CR=1 FL=1
MKTAFRRIAWPTTHGWAILGLGAGLLATFIVLAEDVWHREGFRWDAPIMWALHGWSRPALDGLMWALTQTGAAGATLLAVGLTAWFARRRQWPDAIAVAAAFSGAVILNGLLKGLFVRPRPTLFQPGALASGYSFPSGHVAASTATYGVLAVYLWRAGQRWAALLVGAWVGVVALTRVYLGVHFPSDTVAALASSGLWVLLVFTARDLWVAPRIRRSHPSATTLRRFTPTSCASCTLMAGDPTTPQIPSALQEF